MGSIPRGCPQGVLPLCYLFQVSSASLGTGLSSGKSGDSLEPSCARADKANRAALEAAELSRGILCRGHICLHPLLGSSVFTAARAQNQNTRNPDHLIRNTRSLLNHSQVPERISVSVLFPLLRYWRAFVCCVSFKKKKQSLIPSLEHCTWTF